MNETTNKKIERWFTSGFLIEECDDYAKSISKLCDKHNISPYEFLEYIKQNMSANY